MFAALKRLFSFRRKSRVTPDRVEEVFEYGRKQGISGLNFPDDEEVPALASQVSWQPDPRPWTVKVALRGFQAGEQITIDPHIKWSNDPEYAYIGLVDGKVEFRRGHDTASAWFLCPRAQGEQVAEVEALFERTYAALGLPDSLTTEAPPVVARAAPETESPIRGFVVLTVQYPNPSERQRSPRTAGDLATALAQDMAAHWFPAVPDLAHFAVSEVKAGGSGNEQAYGFDFGPYDKQLDDFVTRHTVVVRTTAGGGFMLLVQQAGEGFGTGMKARFEAIVGRG